MRDTLAIFLLAMGVTQLALAAVSLAIVRMHV